MRNAKRRGGMRDEVWIGGARGVGPRDDEVANERLQRRQECAGIFIGAHPQDDGGGDGTLRITPGLNQGRGGGRRVRAVENDIPTPLP